MTNNKKDEDTKKWNSLSPPEKEEQKIENHQQTKQKRLKKSKKSGKRPWINFIGYIRFDIDEGQVMDHIYPENILLLQEKKLLCLLAFPDSNSFTNEG